MRRRQVVACLKYLNPEWEFKHQRFFLPKTGKVPARATGSSIDHAYLCVTSTLNLSTTLRAGNTVLRAKHPRRSATARFDDIGSWSY